MSLALVQMRLEAKQPFDFAQSLRFLGHFAPTRGEQSLVDATLMKALRVAGRTVVFRLQAVGDSSLDCTLWSQEALTDDEQKAAHTAIGSFLSLQDDLKPFYAIGQKDDAFAPVIEQLYGYHQVRFLTPFENACWAVLTQRTPMNVARVLKEKLVKSFGDSLEIDGVRYEAFPDARTLAALDHDDLVKLLENGRRTEYLLAVAEAFANASDPWLAATSSEDLLVWLRAIKGIGPWSASFILLRGLGRTDILPLGEQRLIAAAQERYGHERAADQDAVAALAAPYGNWQGYWAHYLRVAS